MSTVIYWFRNDLRLLDNPAFTQACQAGTRLLPVYCHDPAGDTVTPWGFARTGAHRRHFLAATLADLAAQLTARGSTLLELDGRPQEVLSALAQRLGATRIVCEYIAAPEEQAEAAALRAAGLNVDTVWQSSLLDPSDLPFTTNRLPDMFTTFRNAVEKAAVLPPAVVPIPAVIPALPDLQEPVRIRSVLAPVEADARSAFPYQSSACAGGATAALAHLDQYFNGQLAHTYKQTRNGLIGLDYSSKFSPWLASGALSARSAYAALKEFEAEQGANDSTYWLWFELLWRDYFRFLHLKYGRKLYRANGLADPDLAAPTHHPAMFARWCRGATGEAIVDAGMRELAATGYLSNRLRQIVASYLIHDLGGDWRAGAAWFEAQLVDYDVTSNQGNWLYLAGRGTDPRGGRRFNPQKQAQDYDADGAYRALWSA
ncbi:DASH family cryptochrome [Actimicrobium antarcticum]|uniref:Cryptochrome DASH n=1 Tax=Actimicrobium antarcticum TaxID=1051899 RepID=A0ABP7T2F3_9BURK